MDFYKLKELDVSGKRVLVRAGFDVPFDDSGEIEEDMRIKSVVPTIKFLGEKRAKVIIISHNGRPKGEIVEKLKMDKVAVRLSELLGINVKKLDDCVGDEVSKAVQAMGEGEVMLLENLRFHKEEKSKDENERDEFGKNLAGLGDVYVNDSFPTCHRSEASMVSIPKYIIGGAGFVVEKELEELSKAVDNPAKPYAAIIGGAKADKIGVIRSMLEKGDHVIIGGVLANTFLKAKGIDIGDSKFDKDTLDAASEFIENEKLILPEDFMLADKFESGANVKVGHVGDDLSGWIIVDIGPKTIAKYKEILKEAKTIVWGGPLGVFEIEEFSVGTKEIAKHISELEGVVSIIGGGGSAAAVNKFGVSDRMTHVSTGGGASLMFLEGEELPAIKALEENKKRFKL